MDSYLTNKFTNHFNQIEEQPNTVNIPILRKIEPDRPILAEENIEMYFPFPNNNDLFNVYNVIGLRITNQQLLFNDMYLNDILLIEQSHEITDGDRVVTIVGDKITSGRFLMGQDRFIIKPEYKTYEMVTSNSFTIIGKVIGIFHIME